MKKVMKLAYLLMGVALLLSSCSEDIFPGGSESNEDVTISLAYSDVSPRDIVVTPELQMQRSVNSKTSTSIYLMAMVI